MSDIKRAILEGHWIALGGVIGRGTTVTLRRLHQQRKDANRVLVAKALAVEKPRRTLGTLRTALFSDLSTEQPLRIPTQSETRARALRERAPEAIALVASQLRTPLPMQRRLTLALAVGY